MIQIEKLGVLLVWIYHLINSKAPQLMCSSFQENCSCATIDHTIVPEASTNKHYNQGKVFFTSLTNDVKRYIFLKRFTTGLRILPC